MNKKMAVSIYQQLNLKYKISEVAKRKKNLKNENSLRVLWDNIKCTNIHIIGVPKEKRESKGIKLKK